MCVWTAVLRMAQPFTPMAQGIPGKLQELLIHFFFSECQFQVTWVSYAIFPLKISVQPATHSGPAVHGKDYFHHPWAWSAHFWKAKLIRQQIKCCMTALCIENDGWYPAFSTFCNKNVTSNPTSDLSEDCSVVERVLHLQQMSWGGTLVTCCIIQFQTLFKEFSFTASK